MTVLWITNIVFPEVRGKFGIRTDFGSGYWLPALVEELAPRVSVVVVSFQRKLADFDIEINKVKYVNRKRHSSQEFEEIVRAYSPDVIHLHGTENTYINLMTDDNLRRLVISIQGIMEDIRKFTMPYGASPMRYPVMVAQGLYLKMLYSQRLRFERKALSACRHVSGRTVYDRYYSLSLNPERVYYEIQRVVRSEFNSFRWTLEGSEPDCIVTNLKVVAAKGLHVLLRAISIVKLYRPGIRLKVIGGGYAPANKYSYSAYLKEQMGTLGLDGNVDFLGYLNAETIAMTLVKCRLFVMPSFMENNSNSLCEAMYTGMPCVCSHTGGLTSMLHDEETGLMFSNGNSYHLASQIVRLLENDELCRTFGERAYAVARKRHDPETVVRETEAMYAKIAESQKY